MRPSVRRSRPPRRPSAALVATALVASIVASAGGSPARAAGPTGVDAETRASSTALAVGAPSAWARGGDGAGVVVGVLDSGVLATHVELAGRLLRGHDALTGGIDTGDANGHGTHVAGLIAAARDGAGIVGVAPQARLLPVRVFTQGAASDAVLSDGIRWAAARAGILNLSLSAGAPIAGAALRDATAGGALVVVAAGNRGAPHPDWPARFAREAWANGPGARGAIVVVGAVDAQHRIADWSNRAGDTASWFLVAPGVDVLSTWASGDDAHARVSGTSMAAPAVSGAAALLQSLWPRLGPREVAAILLATARDLGAPGTDPVYGRGLLDVEAALRPVGPMTTAGAGGEVPLASTGLRTSPATVALARAAARDGLGVVAFDAYRRDYPSDLGARIVAPLPMQAGRAFDAIDARMARIERSLPGGARMTLQPNDSFTMVSRDAAGELAFGAGAAAHEYFGVAAGLDVVALANPYTALAPRGALLARGLALGDTAVKAGVLGGSATESSGSGWTSVDARTTVIEASRRLGDAVLLSATWTRSVEQGAWLGSVGTGGFELAETTRTDALHLGAAWRMAPGAVLAATWAQGRTPGRGGVGLLSGIGDARSDAGSLALVLADALSPGDALSVSLSQPMRTRSGEAVLTLQSGVDADGAAIVAQRRVSLVPEGRERLLEFGYRRAVDRDTQLGAVLAFRREPNHVAGAPDDALVALRLRRGF